MLRCSLLVLLATVLQAEVRPMSLRQAVQLALQQNPDVALARLDEEKARQAVRVARDPFTPRLTAGSGLAYSNGFPMSIEGSAPSVVQARASQFLFNRQQSFTVAQAKEDARGAGITVASKRDEVAYRVASLFLDAERDARMAGIAGRDAESREKVLAAVRAQLGEGRALPLAEKTAEYQLAYARQVASGFADDQATAETALALALGFSAGDRVRPVEAQRPTPALPESEAQALEAAMQSNKDLRHLQSEIASKQLEIRGEKAARWPRVDLVAQYGMLARFNNYQEFFQKFQRNNGEIGMSFQVPLLAGPGVNAEVRESEADIARLRLTLTNTRNRIASDLQQSFREARRTEGAANVARLDLDVAREQLSVDLARMQEGRLALSEVEQARVVENQKWVAFYEAQSAVEKARWNVLRLTGQLVPSIEALP